MNERAQGSSRRHPVLLRIGTSRLSDGFLLLPLLATLVSSGRAEAATPRRFTTVNRSPYAIRAVYACPPRAASWGANLIEGRSLAPGQQVAVELKGGCGVYDLRFVADDGIEFLEDGVPFCQRTAEEAGNAPAAASDREDVITLGRDDLKRTRRAVVPASSSSQVSR